MLRSFVGGAEAHRKLSDGLDASWCRGAPPRAVGFLSNAFSVKQKPYMTFSASEPNGWLGKLSIRGRSVAVLSDHFWQAMRWDSSGTRLCVHWATLTVAKDSHFRKHPTPPFRIEALLLLRHGVNKFSDLT